MVGVFPKSEPHHQKNNVQAPFTVTGASSYFWYLQKGWLG
jgi:hypothetical protein